MSARAVVVGLALLAVGVVFGCRPDPGASHYDQQEPFSQDGGSSADALPGPDPYVPGTQRLSVGAFYEGGYSDVVPVDNASTHVYVYSDTITMMPDNSDFIEGFSSTRITHAGMSWWGFGIHWDAARNLAGWTKLHVSFKSSAAAFATFQIGMSSMNNMNPYSVDVTKYGYTNDGNWHNVVIPVADLVTAGLDVSKVTAPFVLGGGAGTGGDILRIDDLFFSGD